MHAAPPVGDEHVVLGVVARPPRGLGEAVRGYRGQECEEAQAEVDLVSAATHLRR